MLPLLGSLEVVEQRRAIQEEINKRERHILDAKRQLNAFVPILRLPPELLSEILLHYVEIWIADFNCPNHSPTLSAYGWLAATHVCHHWREVALRTPQLWANIAAFDSTVELVNEMIARSGQAALYANVKSDDAAFDPIMNQIHRVAWLIVEFHARGVYPTVIRSAPKLVRIVVSLCSCFDIDSPCLFQDCELPKLTHLDLDRGSFLWSRPLFRPTVTHLSILSTDQSERQFGMQDLMLALEGLPLLEDLDIQEAIPHQSQLAAIPQPLRVLHLSRLDRLHLDDCPEACAALLLHISYPNTATLTIESRLSNDAGDLFGLAELAKAVKVKLSESTSLDVTEQRLSTLAMTREVLLGGVLPLHGICFRGWATKHHVAAFDPAGQTLPAPALEILLKCVDIDTPDLFEHFLHFLPLSTLETLYLSYPPSKAPDLLAWRDTLQPMAHLRELGLGPFAEDVVPDVLSLDGTVADPDSGGNRHFRCVLPALEVLLLHEVAFRPTYKNPNDTVLVEAYRDMLAMRRDAQYALGQIILDRCANVTASDVALLETFVKVQWNPEDVKEIDLEVEHAKATYDPEHLHGMPDIPGLIMTVLQGNQDV